MKKIENILLIMLLVISIHCGKKQDSSNNSQIMRNTKIRIQISLSVNSINISSDFYEKMGLKKIDGREIGKNPWALLTDGNIQYMLSQNSFKSPSLTYFLKNVENRFRDLEQSGLEIHKIKSESSNVISGVLTDPNNFGVTFIEMALHDLPILSVFKKQINLKFREVLIPTLNVDSTNIFWQKLGFNSSDTSEESQHIIRLSDNLINIKIEKASEPHLPILIFQIEKLSDLIEKFKTIGFQNMEEVVDHSNNQKRINLKSPDGHMIYIYQSNI